MFRASLAQLQEALHKSSFGELYMQLQVWAVPENRVVPPEDGQVMPETCRCFEPE
jgi:hypothetical protein